jgi:hypothetical protein
MTMKEHMPLLKEAALAGLKVRLQGEMFVLTTQGVRTTLSPAQLRAQLSEDQAAHEQAIDEAGSDGYDDGYIDSLIRMREGAARVGQDSWSAQDEDAAWALMDDRH